MTPASSMLDLAYDGAAHPKAVGDFSLHFTCAYPTADFQNVFGGEFSVTVLLAPDAAEADPVCVQTVFRKSNVFQIGWAIIGLVAVDVINCLSSRLFAKKSNRHKVVNIHNLTHVFMPKVYNGVSASILRRTFKGFLRSVPNTAAVADLVARNNRGRLPYLYFLHKKPLSYAQTQCKAALAREMGR